MLIQTLGIFLFGGSHLFATLFPAVRNRLKAWVGEAKYKGVYAMISLVGLIFIGWGYVLTRNDGIYLYQPVVWAKHATMVLVLLAFICLSLGKGKSHLRLYLQNPFSIGISLWAVGHLLANGKFPVVMIASTMLVIAVFDIVFSMLRKDWVVFEPKWREDLKAVVIGAVLYGVFLLVFHPYILGVRIVG